MAKRERAATGGGESVAGQIDAELATAALLKRKRGETPSREELSALRRIEAAREERDRWLYYATIPKRHWREMSGRQVKVINEQAVRYGIPFGGPTIDLSAVVRALHDFLANNRAKLAGIDDDDPLMAGGSTPALERYRMARALREEFAYERDLGEWIRRDDVHAGLAIFASILRQAGETLQRQISVDAYEILDDAIRDAQRAFDKHFASADADRSDGPAEDGPGTG